MCVSKHHPISQLSQIQAATDGCLLNNQLIATSTDNRHCALSNTDGNIYLIETPENGQNKTNTRAQK
jgi:hypothetical protein